MQDKYWFNGYAGPDIAFLLGTHGFRFISFLSDPLRSAPFRSDPAAEKIGNWARHGRRDLRVPAGIHER